MSECTRNKNILNEIKYRTPDIVTLQEVEEAQHLYLLQELGNYHGHYVQHAGWRVDGVACLYHTESFELLEAEVVRFEPASREDTFLRGQVLVLEHKATGHKLLLANCHLVFNFSKSALKIAQVTRLLSRLHALRLKYAGAPVTFSPVADCDATVRVYHPRESPLPAVVFCGDFNLTPVSALYSWLTTGVLNEGIVSAALEEILADKMPLSQQSSFSESSSRLVSLARSDSSNKIEGPILKVNASRRNRTRLLSGQAFMFAAHMSFNELKKAVGHDRALHTLEQLSLATTVYPRHPALGDGALLMPQPSYIVPPCVMMSNQVEAQARRTSSVVYSWIRACAPTIDDLMFRRSVMLIRHLPAETPPDELLRALGLDARAVSTLAHFMSQGDSFCLPVLLTSTTALPDQHQPEAIVTEPFFTVFQGKQRGTVDYVYYTFESLQLTAHLALPSETMAAAHGSIPNQAWPLSDHFSLMADFRFRGAEEKAAHVCVEVPNVNSQGTSPAARDAFDRRWHPHQAMLDQAKVKRALWAEELRGYRPFHLPFMSVNE